MYGKAAMTKFEEFEQIIARLRAPDGCPWDLGADPYEPEKALY